MDVTLGDVHQVGEGSKAGFQWCYDGRVLWFTHKNGTTVTRSSKWHGAVDVRFHEPLLGTAYTIIHAIAGI